MIQEIVTGCDLAEHLPHSMGRFVDGRRRSRIVGKRTIGPLLFFGNGRRHLLYSSRSGISDEWGATERRSQIGRDG